ncbi:tail protein X [Lysobacter capsici]|uniref:tail protein X n=1 Tax=Lysobacter capsici TaxID=435897 RepID=UPI001C004E85|nr:tail protein X [Lysobacter capsici]QWF19126.1 tail protein X [Lysobacter capsici]
MRVYAAQGETLDALCWRVLGRTAGVIEAALIANPGLADLGPILPHGTAVDLLPPVATAPAHQTLIQLWD